MVFRTKEQQRREEWGGKGGSFEAYMVGASASEGVTARAACFSEAMMGLDLAKCDDNTEILLLILLLLLLLPLINNKIMVCLGNPKSSE